MQYQVAETQLRTGRHRLTRPIPVEGVTRLQAIWVGLTQLRLIQCQGRPDSPLTPAGIELGHGQEFRQRQRIIHRQARAASGRKSISALTSRPPLGNTIRKGQGQQRSSTADITFFPRPRNITAPPQAQSIKCLQPSAVGAGDRALSCAPGRQRMQTQPEIGRLGYSGRCPHGIALG